MRSVPHLTALHNKFSSRGFEIVAASKETEAKIAGFVSGKSVKFAVVKSSTASAVFTGRGIPRSWVIGVDGKVLWKGHPANLKDSQIEEWVKDLPPASIDKKLSKELNSAVKAYNGGKFGKALVAAKKAGEGEVDEQVASDAKYVIGVVQKLIDSSTGKTDKLRKAGELGKLAAHLEKVADGFKGSEYGTKAGSDLKELKKSKVFKNSIAAEGALADLKPKLEDMRRKSALKKLQKIAKKYPDTNAGKEAAELAGEYED